MEKSAPRPRNARPLAVSPASAFSNSLSTDDIRISSPNPIEMCTKPKASLPTHMSHLPPSSLTKTRRSAGGWNDYPVERSAQHAYAQAPHSSATMSFGNGSYVHIEKLVVQTMVIQNRWSMLGLSGSRLKVIFRAAGDCIACASCGALSTIHWCIRIVLPAMVSTRGSVVATSAKLWCCFRHGPVATYAHIRLLSATTRIAFHYILHDDQAPRVFPGSKSIALESLVLLFTNLIPVFVCATSSSISRTERSWIYILLVACFSAWWLVNALVLHPADYTGFAYGALNQLMRQNPYYFLPRRERSNRKRGAILMQAAARRLFALSSYRRQRRAALRFQAYQKGFKARQSHTRSRNSVILLQALARRRIARLAASCRKDCAISMQAAMRRSIARRRAKRLRKIVVLQAAARRLFALSSYRRQRRAALRFQAYQKGFKARQSHARSRNSVILLQALARRRIARVAASRRKDCATLMQAAMRRSIARRRAKRLRKLVVLQAAARRLFALSSYRRQRRAALRFQAYQKGFKARQSHARSRNSVILLQALARRRIARLAASRRKDCATLMQAAMRRSIARRRAKRLRKIVVLQAAARRLFALSSYRRQRRAALRFQAYQKGFKARQSHARSRNSVILLQALARRRIARVAASRRKDCATLMQAAMRRSIARRRAKRLRKLVTLQAAARRLFALASYRRHRRAAWKCVILLQAFARRWIATRCLKRHRLAMALQARSRRYLAMAAYRLHRRAAVLIESRYRHLNTWRVHNLLFRLIIGAETTTVQHFIARFCVKRLIGLQAVARCFIVSHQLRRAKQHPKARRESARIIQVAWKLRCRRRAQAAALHIQRMARLLAIAQHQYAAALKIQCAFRKFRVTLWRRLLEMKSAIRQCTKRAAIHIQRQIRAHLSVVRPVRVIQAMSRRMIAITRLRQYRAAAVTTQAWIRGLTRARHFDLVRTQTCVIQATLRCFIARRRLWRMRSVAIVVQAAARRSLTAAWLRRRQNAALVIEASQRGMRERRAYNLLFRQVVRLQASVRRHLEMRRHMIVVLQSAARRFMAAAVYHRYRNSAFRIAARERSRKMSRWYRRQRDGVVILQASARRFLARGLYCQYQQIQNQHYLYHVAFAQAGVRRFIACSRFRRARSAILLLQAATRCGMAQRFRAAVIIEARQRSRRVRRVYLKRRQVIVHIQTAMRLSIASRNWQRIRRAVSELQVGARRWLARRCLAAVAIQSRRRVIAARRDYKRKFLFRARLRNQQLVQEAATQIQTMWRGRVAVLLFSRSRQYW